MLTPDEFEEEFFRVLDSGSLDALDALHLAAESNDEYCAAMLSAYKRFQHSIPGFVEPTKEDREENRRRLVELLVQEEAYELAALFRGKESGSSKPQASE